MPTRDEIAEQALQLPAADRAYVADVIEQSLESDGFAAPEIAAAWVEEIERRIEAYDRGDARSVDAFESLNRIRETLAARRGDRAS